MAKQLTPAQIALINKREEEDEARRQAEKLKKGTATAEEGRKLATPTPTLPRFNIAGIQTSTGKFSSAEEARKARVEQTKAKQGLITPEEQKAQATAVGEELKGQVRLAGLQAEKGLEGELERKTEATALLEDISQKQQALSKQQTGAALSGIRAGRAIGREGAVSSAVTAVPAVAQDISGQRQAILNRQVRLQSLQRESTNKRFEEAVKEGKKDIATALQQDLAAIDKEVEAITSEQDFIERARTDADKVLDKLFTTTGALAGLSEEAIQSLSEGSSFPLSVISALRQLDEETVEANKIKDDIEKADKLLQIEERKARIIDEGKTAASRDIEFLQFLQESGADPDVIEDFRIRAGISAKPETALEKAKREKLEREAIDTQLNTTDVIPTGEFITKTFNNRPVTLDTAAMLAFEGASGDFFSEFGEDIKIGAVAVSSTAQQSDRIAFVANDWNLRNPGDIISFDPANPNAAALALQSRGVAVSTVGTHNKHAKGLAIDLFPDEAYIEKVRPFLEAKGWKQTVPVGDNGHFEFQGITQKEFTDSQKAILSTIDPTKINSNTITLLKDSGLTSEDLGTFLATEKKQLTPEKKTEIQDILEGIQSLRAPDTPFRDPTGFKSAVGAGIGKSIPFLGAFLPGDRRFVAGTDAANFEARFNKFKDTLALPALDKLKGAMSDKDIQFLRNTATALSIDMSEKEFIKTLDQLEDKYIKILDGGSTVDLKRRTITDPVEINNIHDMLDSLTAEGVSEEEQIATLEAKGIDSSLFFN